MFAQIRTFLVVLLLLLIAVPVNATLWPMEVGQIWTSIRTDGNDLSWNMELTILEQVTRDSEQYFHGRRWNYNNSGDIADLYLRSTEDTVYFWGSGVGDLALFRANESVGTTWTIGEDEYQRMENELVHVPFLGQDVLGEDIFYEAYVFKIRNWVQNSPPRYEYFVPDIGHVQEVDEWTDNPPTIQQLVSISTVPIPGAVWLLGSGLVGIVGARRKFKK